MKAFPENHKSSMINWDYFQDSNYQEQGPMVTGIASFLILLDILWFCLWDRWHSDLENLSGAADEHSWRSNNRGFFFSRRAGFFPELWRLS